MKKTNEYLNPIKQSKPEKDSFSQKISTLEIKDIKKVLLNLNLDTSVNLVDSFIGGQENAEKALINFIKNKIDRYPELRNDPNKDKTSNLSPYLHFGQISPLHIALEVKKNKSHGNEAFLEELIVRRELSINYVFYNQNYDSFKGLPEWSKFSLKKHKNDKRKYKYTLQEFERVETHNDYWNAAQKQMIKTGKMHGYMRMYWGKKIIEWTNSPIEAHKIALYLNNKYELDGRDSNGFTGIAWCFGKHDCSWVERPIFGKIRYMNANGLKRKFDIDLYAKKYN